MRPPRSRGALVRRLLQTIQALSRDWYGAGDLAEALGVHRRTAYRLIAALLEAGLPLARVTGERSHVRYHLTDRWWEQ